MKKPIPKRRKSSQRRLSIPSCKNFSGYKPCHPGTVCLDGCVDPRPRGTKILLVNLEAMGNVLLTTSLLPVIKRAHPESTIWWITMANAVRLLDGNPYLDRVLVWEPESWLILNSLKFDMILNFDKSLHACALTMGLQARRKVGYGLNADGVIIPLNREAEYNYRLGLDDHLKFRVNQKTTTRILTEAMGFRFKRDEYVVCLSDQEQRFSNDYRRNVLTGKVRGGQTVVVGFNTGCSLLYPNKKMTMDQHLVLIEALSRIPGLRLALLGGPEDTERNAEISRQAGGKVINTPSTEGLRRGLCYINACDLVITGDSFGMHAAIALKKFVIAWFGVSCHQEIDLYDRGVKLVPESLDCSPCWRRECPHNLECIQMIDLDRIVNEVKRFVSSVPGTGSGPLV